MKKITLKNIKRTIKSPTAAFRDVLANDRGFGMPLGIVITGGIFSGISSYFQKLNAYSEFKDVMGGMGKDMVMPAVPGLSMQEPAIISEIARMAILAPLGWLVITALYFVMSKLLKGKAGYSDLLLVGGYAQLPMLFGSILGIGAGLTLPSLAFLPSLIFGLWTLIATIIGVREANAFTTARAVIVVIVPLVILGILLTIIIIGVMLLSLPMGGSGDIPLPPPQ